VRLAIPLPPPEPPRTTASKIRNFSSGLLLFGPVDFLTVTVAVGGGSPTAGVTLVPALALVTAVGLVAVLFVYLRLRMLAAGWVSGYLLMSLFSVGACTLIVDPRSSSGGALSGLVLYFLLFIAAGLTALVSFRFR
jgi:hypothetical protein